MRDVLHWLPVQQRIHYRVSSIVWQCILGRAPFYLRELLTLTISACSGRRSLRSACRGDFMVRALTPPLGNVELSRSLVPLHGILSPLTCAPYLGTCLVLSTNSLKLFFLTGPGSGAPLSSDLEGALYKFLR